MSFVSGAMSPRDSFEIQREVNQLRAPMDNNKKLDEYVTRPSHTALLGTSFNSDVGANLKTAEGEALQNDGDEARSVTSVSLLTHTASESLDEEIIPRRTQVEAPVIKVTKSEYFGGAASGQGVQSGQGQEKAGLLVSG